MFTDIQIDFNKVSNTSFILNHSSNDRIITEVSITNSNELRFLLQGKMEFVIPVLTKTKFGYKGFTTPFWEFIKEGEILASSQPQLDK